MGHLSSCYFCGVAIITPLERYRLPDTDGTTVTLCSTCRHKLDTVLESNGVAGPEALPEDGDAGPTDSGGPEEDTSTRESTLSLGDDDSDTAGGEGILDGPAEAEGLDSAGEEDGPETVDGEDGPAAVGEVDPATVDEGVSPSGNEAEVPDFTDDEELSDPPEGGDDLSKTAEDGDLAEPADAESPDIDAEAFEMSEPDDSDNRDSTSADDDRTEGIDPSILQADEIATGETEIEEVLGETSPSEDAEAGDDDEESDSVRSDDRSGDLPEPDSEGGEAVPSSRDVDAGGSEEDPFADEDPLAEEDALQDDPLEAADNLADEEPLAEEGVLSDENPQDEKSGSLDTNLDELRDGPPDDPDGSAESTDAATTADDSGSTEPTDTTPTAADSGSEPDDRSDSETDSGFTFDQGEDTEGQADQDLQDRMEPDIPEEFGDGESGDGEFGENEPETQDSGAESTPEESSGGGERRQNTSISALEYNKVMRLLQNRTFPVNRIEIETVASNAYELSEDECAEVIDIAIDRGLLAEEDGELHKPE